MRRGALVALAALAVGCGPGWTVLSASVDRACLSSWGPSAKELFVVGGGLGNGAQGLMLHLSSGQWTSVPLGTTDTLWWVFGFSGTDVWAAGENGALYHFDGTTAARVSTPTTATLFGVWGAAPGNLWAVGGSPGTGGPSDVLLHFDGQNWSQVAPPAVLGLAYFKVWGSAANDVFVVGEGGLILHYDGSSWTRQTNPVRGPLLTVAGRSSGDVFAVGGPPAVFAHFDGSAWSAETGPALANGLSGLSPGPRELFVVGLGGVKWRQAADGKWSDDTATAPTQDLHEVWAAPDGSAIAVGGDYVTAGTVGTPRKGVVAYYGSSSPPRIPAAL